MHAAEAGSLDEALQRIADTSRELVESRYAALGVPDGNGGLTHFIVSGISDKRIREIAHPPLGRGLLGTIMHERKPIRLAHMNDDDRAAGFPEGHPPMDAFLGVPIQVGGDELFGMLYLTDKIDGEPFTESDQWLVESLAGYAALAIAGVQLRDQQHRLTLLEERQRIGMALHDGIIQSLYALGMHLDLIRLKSDMPTETFRPVIDGLNTVIEDIRTYIMDLRRANDTEKPCRETLQDVVRNLYIPEDLHVIINAPDTTLPFKEEDMQSIKMIVREAVSNVVRHAEASTVTITVWQNPDHVALIISDDGIGFDPECLKNQNGLGVKNMTHRALMHNGMLEVYSKDGQGTTVDIKIPTPTYVSTS